MILRNHAARGVGKVGVLKTPQSSCKEAMTVAPPRFHGRVGTEPCGHREGIVLLTTMRKYRMHCRHTYIVIRWRLTGVVMYSWSAANAPSELKSQLGVQRSPFL